MAPPSDSIALSVSNCRISRVRGAPSAVRIAISWRRRDPFISSRLATLAHAINNTKATAPMKIRSDFPNPADEQILERENLGGPAISLVAGRHRELRAQGFQFRLRLSLRNRRLQSPEGGPVTGVHRVVSDRQRQPQSSVARKREPGRHDANHGTFDPVHSDGLSQDVRIRRKTAAPEFLAKHSDTRGAGLVFLGGESSAHRRTNTQNRKETRCDEPRRQANGVSHSGHGDLTLAESS